MEPRKDSAANLHDAFARQLLRADSIHAVAVLLLAELRYRNPLQQCVVTSSDWPAKAAGAAIVMDISDQDYGGRGYSCRDPEGHL